MVTNEEFKMTPLQPTMVSIFYQIDNVEYNLKLNYMCVTV